jgi:hypothetical protein
MLRLRWESGILNESADMRRHPSQRAWSWDKPPDDRWGFEWEGRWITPEEAHRMAKKLMDRVDALPEDKRLYLKQHGRLPT